MVATILLLLLLFLLYSVSLYFVLGCPSYYVNEGSEGEPSSACNKRQRSVRSPVVKLDYNGNLAVAK